MERSGDDLGARLPREVSSDLGRWTLYQSFRVVTWPWLLRRGLLFWPIAILAGLVYAAWHASGMGAGDWPWLAFATVSAALLVVSAGPALAPLSRTAVFAPARSRSHRFAILGGLHRLAAVSWTADHAY